MQGSKIALVRSYLQVPQAAGQVKILIFLVKFIFFPIYANIFCGAGQVLILRYFEACLGWNGSISIGYCIEILKSSNDTSLPSVIPHTALFIGPDMKI